MPMSISYTIANTILVWQLAEEDSYNTKHTNTLRSNSSPKAQPPAMPCNICTLLLNCYSNFS
jgi:hypothetical protein